MAQGPSARGTWVGVVVQATLHVNGGGEEVPVMLLRIKKGPPLASDAMPNTHLRVDAVLVDSHDHVLEPDAKVVGQLVIATGEMQGRPVFDAHGNPLSFDAAAPGAFAALRLKQPLKLESR
jgi:hypothetical protein